MNTGALWPTPHEAEARVLRMQAKLHRWAIDDPNRRFADLCNLVADPAFLLVAWRRVRGNRGARSAGIDGQTARSIEAGRGEAAFLADLRADLRARTFRPLPVRERMIPKVGGKRRRLGIPTVRDRVVQAALKARAGAHLRGGLRAVLVWLSARATGAGRDRRDPPLRQPLVWVGGGCEHRGLLGRPITLHPRLRGGRQRGLGRAPGPRSAGPFAVLAARVRRATRRA